MASLITSWRADSIAALIEDQIAGDTVVPFVASEGATTSRTVADTPVTVGQYRLG